MFSRLYNIFPRQIGFKGNRIIVQNKQQFIDIVNNYNGKVRIFGSVYNYTPEEEHKVIVDKVFIDLDSDDALGDIRRLGEYLSNNSIAHSIFFSGKGFHCYVYIDMSVRIINRRDCIANIQKHFEKECNITINPYIIGDIARIATVPGTYNIKRQRFCIPLTLRDIAMSYDEIREKAKTQIVGVIVNGNKRFNPEPFDKPSEYQYSEYEKLYELDTDRLEDHSIHGLSFHPCINAILSNGNTCHFGYRGRYHLITYLRDTGITIGMALNLIKSNLINVHDGKPEWQHCFRKRQVEKIYANDEYPFVRCETLKTEGLCPCNGQCERSINYGSYYKADIYK